MSQASSSSKRVRGVSSLRSFAENAAEEARKAHEAELARHRLQVLREGVQAIVDRKWSAGVRALARYVRLVETAKGAMPGCLMPAHFDPVAEMRDCLVLSGVYWDLARIFDRVKNGRPEMTKYLEKFVLFSKGTNYQPVCSEMLRKYVLSGKVKHLGEFRSAYRVLSGRDLFCFVATELSDVIQPLTIDRLRFFRDLVLYEHAWGRFLIAAYYRTGPSLAALMHRLPDAVRRLCGRVLDRLGYLAERHLLDPGPRSRGP